MTDNEKDIDLVQIFIKVGDFFGRIWSSLGNLVAFVIRFSYRKRLYFLGALLASVAFTAWWARPSHRVYQMETEVRINMLDAFFFNDQINRLDLLCQNGDYLSLSHQLGLSPAACERFKRTESFFIVDKLCDGTPDEVCYGKYKADTTQRQMDDRLLIRLSVSDTSNFSQLRAAMLYFFDSNPVISKMNVERLAQINGRINSIGREVSILDSLRYKEYFKEKEPQMHLDGSMIVSEKDKRLYHSDILSLKKDEDDNVYEKTVNGDCVNFVSDFFLVKVDNGYVQTFIYSLIGFFILTFFIALFVDRRQQMKAWLEK